MPEIGQGSLLKYSQDFTQSETLTIFLLPAIFVLVIFR